MVASRLDAKTDPTVWRARRLVALAQKAISSKRTDRKTAVLAAELKAIVESLRGSATELSEELQALMVRLNAAHAYQVSSNRVAQGKSNRR
jgi:predicted enzyme involved in methoxymalonyl-ACP biosynthesis